MFINLVPCFSILQLTVSGVESEYCIMGNFRGRKLSWILRFCSYWQKFSPQNLWVWHLLEATPVHKSFLCENLISTKSRKFSPSKVSRYTQLLKYVPTCQVNQWKLPIQLLWNAEEKGETMRAEAVHTTLAIAKPRLASFWQWSGTRHAILMNAGWPKLCLMFCKDWHRMSYERWF